VRIRHIVIKALYFRTLKAKYRSKLLVRNSRAWIFISRHCIQL